MSRKKIRPRRGWKEPLVEDPAPKFSEAERAELSAVGVPEHALVNLEGALGSLMMVQSEKAPTPAEIVAAAEAIGAPAIALSEALRVADECTASILDAYLHRSGGIKASQDHLRQLCQALEKIIERERVKNHKWAGERRRAIAATIRTALMQCGVAWTKTAGGPAATALDLIFRRLGVPTGTIRNYL